MLLVEIFIIILVELLLLLLLKLWTNFLWRVFLFYRINKFSLNIFNRYRGKVGKIGVEDFLIKKEIIILEDRGEKSFQLLLLKDIYIVLHFCIIGFFIEKQLRIEHG